MNDESGRRLSKCEQCGTDVIVLVEDGRQFDAKPTRALFQQADGLWGFETVHAEHVCPEEAEERKETEDAG